MDRGGRRKDRKVWIPREVGLIIALSNEENEVLYLECYRYVLRGQIKALISLGLPDELEVTVSLYCIDIRE